MVEQCIGGIGLVIDEVIFGSLQSEHLNKSAKIESQNARGYLETLHVKARDVSHFTVRI